ncbi:MAG: hypothetical protein IKH93_01220 [Bacteroidales bacterium]|nr:hypothetical protein [Bacteroidales bacterium]
MKKSIYKTPESDILEVNLCWVICQSVAGRQVVYGDEGKAGGDINDDNYVDGGTF